MHSHKLICFLAFLLIRAKAFNEVNSSTFDSIAAGQYSTVDGWYSLGPNFFITDYLSWGPGISLIQTDPLTDICFDYQSLVIDGLYFIHLFYKFDPPVSPPPYSLNFVLSWNGFIVFSENIPQTYIENIVVKVQVRANTNSINHLCFNLDYDPSIL